MWEQPTPAAGGLRGCERVQILESEARLGRGFPLNSACAASAPSARAGAGQLHCRARVHVLRVDGAVLLKD
jgi:hypothetical protein